MKMKMIVRSPPDGNCLFHSFSRGLKVIGVHRFYAGTRCVDNTPENLRLVCGFFVLTRPREKVAGEEVLKWIQMSGYATANEYASNICSPHVWATGTEIAILSHLFRVEVDVWQNGCKISQYLPSSPHSGLGINTNKDNKSTISLEFNGSHYDLILECGEV